MNIENAKQEFTKYVSKYDLENEKIKMKFGHSFRVMEDAGEIAKSLGLNNEDVELAKLIGLLHDIGRFEQIRIYDTFKDHVSIDHGDLGVQILRELNYIRKYIEDDKYDNIILKSIKNHNKFKIEDGLDERELLFAKIIRDADKLDIFYEGVEMFWITEEEIKKVNKSKLSKEVLEEFNSHYLIDRKKIITEADDIISFMALMYDIYFKYDYIIMKKENYLNKIFDKFSFEDEVTQKQMEKVRKIANEYIDMKRNEAI